MSTEDVPRIRFAGGDRWGNSLDFCQPPTLDDWQRASDTSSIHNKLTSISKRRTYRAELGLCQWPIHLTFSAIVSETNPPEEITKHFVNFLGTDGLLVKTAAQEMVTWLQSADPLIVPDALDFMVTRGVIKKFADLFRGSTEELEGLAGVIFGFLANGDTRHATIAFNAGILPICIERLSTGDLEARIKSAWILGNLAADNAECAEALMEKGVLEIMFDQMTTITNANEISSHGPYSSMLLWAINHFLKSTPGLSPNIVLPIQNLLARILLSNVEDVVLEETCYSLASIIQLSTDPCYGSPFTSEKTCGRLIRLLQRGSNIPLQRASLQLVGGLTGRSDEYTTLLLRNNLLEALAELVEHPLGEDACWVLSNVVAENVEHMRVVVFDSRVLPTVIRLLKVDSSGFDEDEFAGRTREGCNILAAVIRMGQVDCIRRMVELGGISALCTALLYVAEADVLVVILDALWKVVLFGESDRIVVGALQWQGMEGDAMEGEMEGKGDAVRGIAGGLGGMDGELGLQGMRTEGDAGVDEPVNLYLRLFEENGGFDGLYRLENRKDRVVAEAAQQMLALLEEIMNPPDQVEDDDAMEEATSTEGITEGMASRDGMANGNGTPYGDLSKRGDVRDLGG